MLKNRKLTKNIRVQRKPFLRLCRPPRLQGEVARARLKLVRKKKREKK